MTRLLFIVLLFLSNYCTTYAQQTVLKGQITDSINKQQLHNAVIAILSPKDSILINYTRSNKDGAFELSNINEGKYLILISYPNYADYLDKIEIAGNTITDLGKLILLTKETILQEVIVKQHISAVRVKGDTTEYKADSFRVSANADVQELLKKMPGIQVNSKGEISTQGEKVQKILVDGEEFFSDDPAVVTKNLRADAVDKVQAFDKKSDQATFTGIDDGQKIKTLNIQLKEDKKKGYFGKAEIGSDFKNYNYGKLLANSFKGKRKFSGYLTKDNTKYESLDWNENRNYAGDVNTTTEMNEDGGMMIFSSGDEFSWGTGYPSSVTGGLHFSNKWNKDKQNSNNTFQFNQIDITGLTTNKTQYLLPDTSFTNTTQQNQNASKKRNKLKSIYEWQIDSSSSLKLTATGNIINSNSTINYLGRSISADNKIINETNRYTKNENSNNALITNLLWKKKFKKPGRTITSNIELNLNNIDETGFLNAINNYYESNGSLLRNELIDQKKINQQSISTFNTNISYTEPIWKNTFLVFNYRLNINKNNSEKITLGKNANEKYENIVDSFSNHYMYNSISNTGSINLKYNKKKFNFSIGSGYGTAVYTLNDIKKNSNKDVQFNRFIPSVTLNYTPKQQRKLNFSYSGTTQNPTLQEIQPIIDNIDPLNLVIGNPDLKQSFTNNFQLRATDYKVLKSRYISIRANLRQTNNAISLSSQIDQFGRRISQSINVDGNYSLSGNIDYGMEVASSVNVSLSMGPKKEQFVNKVNGVNNTTLNNAITIGLNSGYWGDKLINYWLNVEANKNESKNSIRPDIITKYWSYNGYGNLQFKLKKAKTYIDINLEANIYEKTAAFAQQQNIFLLSSSIRKVISKNDQLELKFYVNDILNQNQGINRNISSNFISETTNNIIQRYALLSLIWNFSKNGKPSEF